MRERRRGGPVSGVPSPGDTRRPARGADTRPVRKSWPPGRPRREHAWAASC